MSGEVPGEKWIMYRYRCGKALNDILNFLSTMCETFQREGILEPHGFPLTWIEFLQKTKRFRNHGKKADDLQIQLLYDYYRSMIYIDAGYEIHCKIPIKLSTWDDMLQLEGHLFHRATIVSTVNDKAVIISLLKRLRNYSSVREILETIQILNPQVGWAQRVKRFLHGLFRKQSPTYRLSIQFDFKKKFFHFVLSRWVNGKGDSLYIRDIRISDLKYGIHDMVNHNVISFIYDILHKRITHLPSIHNAMGVFPMASEDCEKIDYLFKEMVELYPDEVPSDIFTDFYRNINASCSVSMMDTEKPATENLAISFMYIAPLHGVICSLEKINKPSQQYYFFNITGDLNKMEKEIYKTQTAIIYIKDSDFDKKVSILKSIPNYHVSGSTELRNIIRSIVPSQYSYNRIDPNGKDNFILITKQAHKGSCHIHVWVGSVVGDTLHDNMMDIMTQVKLIEEKTFIVEDIVGTWCKFSPLKLLQQQQKQQQKQQQQKQKQKQLQIKYELQESQQQEERSLTQKQLTKMKFSPTLILPTRQIVSLDRNDQLTMNNIKRIKGEILKKKIAMILLNKAYEKKASRIIIVDGPNLTWDSSASFKEREDYIASSKFAEKMVKEHSLSNQVAVFMIVSQKNINSVRDDHVSFHESSYTFGKNVVFHCKVACFDENSRRNCHAIQDQKNECDDFVRMDTMGRLFLMIRNVRKELDTTLEMNNVFIQGIRRLHQNRYSNLSVESKRLMQKSDKIFTDLKYYLSYPSIISITNDKGSNWKLIPQRQ